MSVFWGLIILAIITFICYQKFVKKQKIKNLKHQNQLLELQNDLVSKHSEKEKMMEMTLEESTRADMDKSINLK